MDKIELVDRFTSSVVKKKRRNEISTVQVTGTLTNAALNSAFLNESCKSTGQVSKSQVIYRKLDRSSKETIEDYFRENTIIFLKSLKACGVRRFLISFDTTKEAFYGDLSKAEDKDKLYIHSGSIARGSKYYYEYLTVSITCDVQTKYILDGAILPAGCYVEDLVYDMLEFIMRYIHLELVLFDRGFDSWGLIHKLRDLHIPYLIFWEKQGEWYKKYFKGMKEGEFMRVERTGIYNRDKTNHKVSSDFILIKQLEYEGKKYDWIFATNMELETAASYVKRYKKRWCIETIYRITDDIRIYTTSTNSLIRYFLFMFTCLVYNIWRLFQLFLGGRFTLANFKTSLTFFMARHGMIYPKHYEEFRRVAIRFFA
jgi:hypothetical protein